MTIKTNLLSDVEKENLIYCILNDPSSEYSKLNKTVKGSVSGLNIEIMPWFSLFYQRYSFIIFIRDPLLPNSKRRKEALENTEASDNLIMLFRHKISARKSTEEEIIDLENKEILKKLKTII